MYQTNKNYDGYKSKNKEYNHFDSLSNEWWDEKGKFKILHHIRPLRMQYILDQINTDNLSELNILDIGCGGGLISESLARLGGNVTGVDFVEKNIFLAKQHSKEKNLKINYICEDIEKVKLTKKFDIILMLEVLEHLDDWKLFISKIKKNLNTKGVIIISTINRNLISKYTTILLAENILNWIPVGTHDFNKFIKPNEIKEISNNEDLKFRNLKGLVYFPITNEWKFSKNTTVNYFCSLYKS